MLAATHSFAGALIAPGLVFLMVAPAVVARLRGWGDTSAERAARKACPKCGDPQGEGACESGECIAALSGYGITPYEPYAPSEHDIAEGYIRLLERGSIYR